MDCPFLGQGIGAHDGNRAPLLDLPDALVEERAGFPPHGSLGMKYHMLSHCCDSRQASRQARQALVDFHAARGPVHVGDTDGAGTVGNAEAPELRVEKL